MSRGASHWFSHRELGGYFALFALLAIAVAGLSIPPGSPPVLSSAPALSLPASVPPTKSATSTLPRTTRQQATDAYGNLPLSFVPNRGQTDKSVRYYAEGAGHAFYFTPEKAVLTFTKKDNGVALDLTPLGASPNARLEASERGPGKVNYLVGSERHPNLPIYREVAYRNLWPGVDLVFRGRGAALEYELHLKPGADPSKIGLAYRGADGLSIGRGGNLLIQTPLGTLRDSRPRSYQRIGGRRVPVDSRYALKKGGSAYGFALGASYDPRRALVIDPGLNYSTYLGGAGSDEGFGIAVDGAGSAYVTGDSVSSDFPTTAGAFEPTYSGGEDAFVTKLSPDGSSLVYSTFLGGTSSDVGKGIAVDASGNAYVGGVTFSSDFPTTAAAFDVSSNGGYDAFVTELNADGSALSYSTYLGGAGYDEVKGIAIDGADNAYVTGYTGSADFATSAGALDPALTGLYDAFVTKLNATGSALSYSTYLGGSFFDQGNAIAVDGAGSAYVTGSGTSTDFPTTAGAFDTSSNGGSDAFATKLDSAGAALTYSTYLGGSLDDQGNGIAVDGAGSAYVIGYTASVGPGTGTPFPTTSGAFDTIYNGGGDGFVTKLNTAGAALTYSTFLGGTGYDQGNGIAVDGAGRAYVTGYTNSTPGSSVTDTPFPTTAGAFDTTYNGAYDAFLTKVDVAGATLTYSTFLGGTDGDYGRAIAADGSNNAAYVTGSTASSGFPTTPGAFDISQNGSSDAFVTKLRLTDDYARPIGASPIRVPLVPVFTGCASGSANSTHGQPLNFASCNPPARVSSTARLGTGSIGFVNLLVCNVGATSSGCGEPGLAEPDVRLVANLRDVRCATSVPVGCSAGADYAPNAGAGPYTSACTSAASCNSTGKASPYCAQSGTSQSDCVAGADLTLTATFPGAAAGTGLRITDSNNGSGHDIAATVADSGFPIPMDCLPTPSQSSVGSVCGVNTSANALSPGVVRTGDKAVWELGEFQVLDSGPDGIRGDADDQILAAQGIYVP
jgi:beta-propeller repeat-containing protein